MPPISDDVLARARRIRLLILDVDGVLTDGRLFFDATGYEFKAFHARDGLGIKLLQASGVALAVISARKARSVSERMQGLGVQHIYQGQSDKRVAYARLLKDLGLRKEQTAYVGDDWIDLPVMVQVGLSVAVQDADAELVKRAHYHCQLPGGQGAVREVCTLIMTAQNTLDEQLQAHLI